MDCSKNNYCFFVETMRRNGKTAVECLNILKKAWGTTSPSRATVFKTYLQFKSEERESFADLEKSGRPSMSTTEENVDIVKKIIDEDCHISIRDIVKISKLSIGSVHRIIHGNVQLRKLSARCIPHDLNVDQRQFRVTCATKWIQNFEAVDPCNIVFTDEKWFYLRSVGTKSTNAPWCESVANKPIVVRRSISDKKLMAIVAVTLGGKWCYQILDSSVNSDAYINFLQSMHKKFVHQRHSLPWKNTVLIHDNARPHVSLQTQNFFLVKNVTLWKQIPIYRTSIFWTV